MTDDFVILVVDDNANNRFTLRVLLSRLPETEVIEAAAGEEALMHTVTRDIHLILLDVQMPGMDGFETARHLLMTERTRNIPIIFLTAVFKAKEFIERGFAIGAVDYLTKPLEDNLLLSRVRFYQVLHARENRLADVVRQLRRQERSLSIALSQAEAANRTKSIFLANMSHELRTPLNAIIGFSEMMQGQVFGPLGSDKYADYCGHIKESGDYLLGVISDVLDMSRLDAGQIALERNDFDLGQSVLSAIRRIELAADEKAIAIDLKRPTHAAYQGDRNAIEKSLGIILRNAVKFTGNSGAVSVRVRQTASGYNVFVADNGPGMPRECIARIGRPFEQFHSQVDNGMKGSGLGLAIAHSLITLHSGRLKVRSQQGRGTVVQFHLPARLAA